MDVHKHPQSLRTEIQFPKVNLVGTKRCHKRLWQTFWGKYFLLHGVQSVYGPSLKFVEKSIKLVLITLPREIIPIQTPHIF